MHNSLYSNALKLRKSFFYDLTFLLVYIQFCLTQTALCVYNIFSYQIIFQPKFPDEILQVCEHVYDFWWIIPKMCSRNRTTRFSNASIKGKCK